jgi:RNA polymerase sigma factor (sigma-70 family)
MSDGEEFARLTNPFRRELLAHCYRMLGSLDDAEDLVQETYLRAWRAYAGFEGRSSLRVWLHRIATNTCLNALETRSRRPLPSGLGGPSDAPESPPVATGAEVPWLEPIPDRMFEPVSDDPAAVIASRGSLRLALVAAMQHLPARQRAVLVLRDVVACSASDQGDDADGGRDHGLDQRHLGCPYHSVDDQQHHRGDHDGPRDVEPLRGPLRPSVVRLTQHGVSLNAALESLGEWGTERIRRIGADKVSVDVAGAVPR